MSDELIVSYFNKNFKQEEIVNILQCKHNVKISLSTLQRRLANLGLKRKNIPESNLRAVIAAIVEELYSCEFNLGYRAMWLKLKNSIYKISIIL